MAILELKVLKGSAGGLLAGIGVILVARLAAPVLWAAARPLLKETVKGYLALQGLARPREATAEPIPPGQTAAEPTQAAAAVGEGAVLREETSPAASEPASERAAETAEAAEPAATAKALPRTRPKAAKGEKPVRTPKAKELDASAQPSSKPRKKAPIRRTGAPHTRKGGPGEGSAGG